ncbi:MAG: NifU family protein [Acidimicrobiales bacterium]
MGGFDELVDRLEELLSGIEGLDEEPRRLAFELLDGVDTIHRFALRRLADQLGADAVVGLRAADPAVSWLFDVYGIGIDEVAMADAALEHVRPYIHSHGGQVEVLGADGGVVQLRMSGTCSGCTASAVTLQTSIDEALREHMPGFLRTEVEEDTAEPHPPPMGPVPIELRSRRA